MFQSCKLRLETDLGKKKFLLDAGATLSLISLSKEEKEMVSVGNYSEDVFVSNKLNMNDTNFGSWKFQIIDIAKVFDVDGLLGVDFFNKHIIAFDFLNSKVYIQAPKLGSKERFTYWLKSYFGK